jgi:predicted Ser/Thr protein kinase
MSGDREVSAEERERWRQVTALVDAAFDLPASERESYLQEHSADESIREAVRRILRVGEADVRAADPFAGVHLASLVDSLVSTSGEFPAAAPRRPQRVGRFRVVRRLGEGGMGTVYLAERDDGEFSQSVALKLVRHGLRHDERIVRRFREERQLLSTLNHASIARLVDGGLTDDGIPWFAMEYVEGSALDRYCDDNRLTVEQRLELFARVCDAVAHAHAAGVDHRDIKPTNILVERDGTPKLLDLGIARLVATEGTAESHVVTRTGERMLTPEYASPEQILGGDVTRRRRMSTRWGCCCTSC